MSQTLPPWSSVQGAIVVKMKAPSLMTEFRDYFVNLEADPSQNSGNPWFQSWLV